MSDARTPSPGKPISQKALADYLKLSPSTVSLVMNDAPRAQLIPEATRARILAAAAQFDYRPDFYAKYLYSKRSYTAAVLLPEVRSPYAAGILAGCDRSLTERKFLYFTANHYDDPDLVREYPRRLLERAVEGFLLINTTPAADPGVPVVMIGSSPRVSGIPRFALDNHRGGAQAVEHLYKLGHRKFAVIKGHPWRSASALRFEGIAEALQQHNCPLDPRLIKELHSHNTATEASAPEEGLRCTQELLKAGAPFTALIAFNDVTAIGAIRALREAGLEVPRDVSVIGFDDIENAAFMTPSLTTLQQPIELMGEYAATHLCDLIDKKADPLTERLLEATLIERESTAPLPRTTKRPKKS